MKKRLYAEGRTDETETRDSHVHRAGTSDNNRSNGTAQGEDNKEPFSSPEIGSLGDNRAKDDGENSDRG